MVGTGAGDDGGKGMAPSNSWIVAEASVCLFFEDRLWPNDSGTGNKGTGCYHGVSFFSAAVRGPLLHPAADRSMGPGWTQVLVLGELATPGWLDVPAGFGINCPPKVLGFRLFRARRALPTWIACLIYLLKLSIWDWVIILSYLIT